jgi:hypothetical protein
VLLNALGAFLDIEGALDGTSFDTIKQPAKNPGIEVAICRWICAMLESRNIIATLSAETLGAPAVRPTYVLVFPVVSFLLDFPPISYMHSASPPFVLHALPISSFLT